MKSILFNSLVIDRTQIIEVTAKQFTVRDASVTELEFNPVGRAARDEVKPIPILSIAVSKRLR